MSDRGAFLVADAVLRRYPGGVEALSGVSFRAQAGEVVAVTGPSGCGKSTLLSLLGLLDQPTSGRITIDGRDLSTIPDPTAFRAQSIGFVFQFHHMIPTMTLLENVAAPLIAVGVRRRERQERASAILDQMGLSHRAAFLPRNVSGGERQRAAVARALVNGPAVILADEPTGNLDTRNGERVVELIVRHARAAGALAILATHNPEVAAVADWCLELRDGRLVSPPSPAQPDAPVLEPAGT